MKTVLFALYAALLLCACGKPAAEKDKIFPVVAISSPANGQTFTPGQPIPINATILDETYIAEVHVHVSNTNTGELLMDVHEYPAGKTGNITQSITAVSGVNYKIQVIAKDRAVNESRAYVEVTCN
jgi:Bacterial Ig domain